MPIRTNRNGASHIATATFALVASIGLSVVPVSLANTAVMDDMTDVNATKGVRTIGVSRAEAANRRPAYQAPALPQEVAGDSSTDEIVAKAKGFVGSRYRYGGTNPKTGFDCTGFVRYVYGDRAGALPRSSAAMYRSITKTGELRPGDIVFFGRRGYVRHAAIYIGDGKVVHASTPRTGVRVDSVATLSRALGWAGAGRI